MFDARRCTTVVGRSVIPKPFIQDILGICRYDVAFNLNLCTPLNLLFQPKRLTPVHNIEHPRVGLRFFVCSYMKAKSSRREMKPENLNK